MKTTIIFLALAAAFLLSASIASAQSLNRYPPSPAYSPPLFQRHASTYEEGVLRGAADFARARGDYNYNTALSLIFREQARSLYLDNKIKYTQTFFERRRINREAREIENGPKPTQQDFERYSRWRLPERLSESSYNRTLAKLQWPKALESDSFAANRDKVNEIVANRPYNDGAENPELRVAVQEMKNELKSQIRGMSPADYVAAKRFLKGLDFEMNFPAVASRVAAR